MPVHTCGWCLESGEGILLSVGSSLILSTHAECIHEAEKHDKCVCLGIVGDNPACPIHVYGGE